MKQIASSKFLDQNIDAKFNITQKGMGLLVKETKAITPVIIDYVTSRDLKARSSWARNLVSKDIESVVASVLNIVFSEVSLSKQTKSVTASMSNSVGRMFYKHLDNKERIQAAAGLLGSVINNCSILEKYIKNIGNKSRVYYSFKEEFAQEVIDSVVEQADTRIYPMPMTEPPVDWNYKLASEGAIKNRYWTLVGGYKTHQVDLVRGSNLNLRKLKRPVFNALNKIQSVPFRINKAVLDKVKSEIGECPKKTDFIESNYYNDAYKEFDQARSLFVYAIHDRITCNITSMDMKTELKDAKARYEYSKDIYAEKKAKYREANSRYLTEKGKWITNSLAISIAEKYKDEPEIYFPHNYDYRGRIYPIPIALNPQGNDVVKSMLEFAYPQATSAGGIAQTVAYLASLFGHDKEPIAKRAEMGMDLIYADYHDADEPYMAYQIQLFLQRYVETGDNKSHHHIALDGSCNGLI